MDYNIIFEEFVTIKNIDLDKERTREGTVNGFVKWMLMNNKQIVLTDLTLWANGYIGVN